MEFNDLLSNPKQFILNTAQITDEAPDLGIKNKIDSFLHENPNLINQIPMVATLGHLQMAIPGSLVRIRCILVQFIKNEYLSLRIFANGKYYTSIFQQDIPEGAEVPDIRSMSSRKSILVSSIPFVSQWLVSELTPNMQPPDLHLNLQEFSPEKEIRLFEEPFQLNAKFLFEQPDKPCLIYDLIGFVEDPAPFAQKSDWDFGEESFFSSIPSFIALTSIPVQSLYIPQIPLPEPSLSEIRGHLMSFLTQVFDPPQAELLLLWMTGSVKARKNEILLGLFSLNFFGATPLIAKLVIHILKLLFTSLIEIPLTIESLNSITFQPSIENEQLKPSPLLAACETRLIIDETQLDVGNFNEIGIENCRILQKIINQQIIDYAYEGQQFPIYVSYPTLILSNSRSVLSDSLNTVQAFYPIGNIKQPQISIDPSLLILIRRYIENIRFCDFEISNEDSDFTAKGLNELLKASREIGQNDLHLLMIICKLSCISMGTNRITQEIWDHSVQILLSILPHKKK